MIDTIRSIIADVASGQIKDAKIVALSLEVIAITDRNSELTAKLEVLEMEIQNLKAELVIHKPP